MVIPIVVATFATSANRSGRSVPSALDWLWAFLAVFSMFGYFTYFWARGQSPGMKAVGVQIIDPKTGRQPGVARAVVRTLLFLILLASAFILLSVGFSDPPTGGFPRHRPGSDLFPALPILEQSCGLLLDDLGPQEADIAR
jgi:uncharacterized RDD family membrane protein YckC